VHTVLIVRARRHTASVFSADDGAGEQRGRECARAWRQHVARAPVRSARVDAAAADDKHTHNDDGECDAWRRRERQADGRARATRCQRQTVCVSLRLTRKISVTHAHSGVLSSSGIAAAQSNSLHSYLSTLLFDVCSARAL
jgi:hypothetical protein